VQVASADEVVQSHPSTDNAWLGLHGARVVVAGVGGIGGQCARAFAEAGAEVLVVDRDEDRLAEVCLPRGWESETLLSVRSDLTEEGSGARVIEEAVRRMGGLDVLLHSVGINDRRPILEFTEAQWERVVKTNLFTAFGIAQAAGRHMVAAGSGRVIFLSSVSGLLAHKNHGPYAASKGGLNQLMRVMAAEWASSGVTVNAIAPGYVETPLTSAHLARPGVRAELESLIPAGRLGVPAEVVGPALFLASPHASYITGHVLYSDGGRTLV